MNHGAPAATTTRSGNSGSKIRNAPRSSALWATTVRSPSCSVTTWGTIWRQWANRSVGAACSTGWPQRKRGTIGWDSITGMTSTQPDHAPLAGTTAYDAHVVLGQR